MIIIQLWELSSVDCVTVSAVCPASSVRIMTKPPENVILCGVCVAIRCPKLVPLVSVCLLALVGWWLRRAGCVARLSSPGFSAVPTNDRNRGDPRALKRQPRDSQAHAAPRRGRRHRHTVAAAQAPQPSNPHSSTSSGDGPVRGRLPSGEPRELAQPERDAHRAGVPESQRHADD